MSSRPTHSIDIVQAAATRAPANLKPKGPTYGSQRVENGKKTGPTYGYNIVLKASIEAIAPFQFFSASAEVSFGNFARTPEVAAATSGENASRPVRPGNPGH